MGVQGLTTFIKDQQSQCLTDQRLCDTKLVIDANNIYHFLYELYPVAQEYGGDYDRFSNCCESFFESLRSCGIEPYVVLDGACPGDKFQTSLDRANARLSKLVESGESAKILPLHAPEVFCSAVKRLKIPHVMCDFEADHQVAALANEWHCPVLTSDSDFFIFNVEAGVILMDFIELEQPVTGATEMNLTTHDGAVPSTLSKPETQSYDLPVPLLKTHRLPPGSVSSHYLPVRNFSCKSLMKTLKTNDHRLVAFFAALFKIINE